MRACFLRTAVLLAGLGWMVVGCERGDEASAPASPPLSPTAETQVSLAPGYGPLGFHAPEPGTYALPPLGAAADGRVVSSEGLPISLHSVLGGKVTLLSLMYASCSDVNGCPLSTAVLHQIASRMHKDTQLAGGLRLVSLSFDPARDTPAVMRAYAGHHAGHGVDWQFLTTASQMELKPILAGYGQSR